MKKRGRASLRVTVTPLPDAPVAVNDAATVDEEVATNIAVAANDDDADEGGGEIADTAFSSRFLQRLSSGIGW